MPTHDQHSENMEEDYMDTLEEDEEFDDVDSDWMVADDWRRNFWTSLSISLFHFPICTIGLKVNWMNADFACFIPIVYFCFFGSSKYY